MSLGRHERSAEPWRSPNCRVVSRRTLLAQRPARPRRGLAWGRARRARGMRRRSRRPAARPRRRFPRALARRDQCARRHRPDGRRARRRRPGRARGRADASCSRRCRRPARSTRCSTRIGTPSRRARTSRWAQAGATIVAQENTKLWLTTDVTWPWNDETVEPLPKVGATEQNVLWRNRARRRRSNRAVRASARLPAYRRRHVCVLPRRQRARRRRCRHGRGLAGHRLVDRRLDRRARRRPRHAVLRRERRARASCRRAAPC